MILRGFILSILLVMASCKSQKTQLDNANSENGMELLLQDAYYPVDKRQALAIKSEKELRAFFSKVNRTRKPGLPVPQIDFTQEMALVICAGEYKGNGMPSLEKLKVGGEIVSINIEMKSTNAEIPEDIVNYPFAIYKMPKTNAKISFTWQ